MGWIFICIWFLLGDGSLECRCYWESAKQPAPATARPNKAEVRAAAKPRVTYSRGQ